MSASFGPVHHIHYPDEEFIRAASEKADQNATAYTGNDHMMTGYGDGFRAGAWWAYQQLTTNDTPKRDDE